MTSTRQQGELLAALGRQDFNRAGWEGLRGKHGRGSAWPTQDNPIVPMLARKMRKSLAAGEDLEDALLDALVHAWYEGHIEGYDHGQRDARGLPDTDRDNERRGDVA